MEDPVVVKSCFKMGELVVVKPGGTRATDRWVDGKVTGLVSENVVEVNRMNRHMTDMRSRRGRNPEELESESDALFDSWCIQRQWNHKPLGVVEEQDGVQQVEEEHRELGRELLQCSGQETRQPAHLQDYVVGDMEE